MAPCHHDRIGQRRRHSAQDRNIHTRGSLRWRAFLRGEAPRLGRDWLYDEDTKRYAVYTDSGHYRIAISVPRAILVPSVSRILELGLEEPER